MFAVRMPQGVIHRIAVYDAGYRRDVQVIYVLLNSSCWQRTFHIFQLTSRYAGNNSSMPIVMKEVSCCRAREAIFEI